MVVLDRTTPAYQGVQDVVYGTATVLRKKSRIDLSFPDTYCWQCEFMLRFDEQEG